MKPAIPLLVLCACAHLRPSPGRVTVEHDEYTGRTSVVLRGMVISTTDGAMRFASIWMPGSPAVLVSFTSSSGGGWRYLRCHSLALQHDGHPYPIDDTEHDGSVGQGSFVTETVSASIPIHAVERLATARKLRGRLCRAEFTFDDEQRATLRTFVGRATTTARVAN